MNKSILDTDILSELFKCKNYAVIAKATLYRAEWRKLTTSTLTIVEVVKGLQKRRLDNQLSRFVSTLPSWQVLTLDTVSAEMAGKISAELESTGLTIGRVDPMIAAIAIRYEMTLVTGNTAHYQRVIDCGYALKLDNWKV